MSQEVSSPECETSNLAELYEEISRLEKYKKRLLEDISRLEKLVDEKEEDVREARESRNASTQTHARFKRMRVVL